jgi:serine/threonine-protein kinase
MDRARLLDRLAEAVSPRYRSVSEAGHGAMATVFRAEDRASGRAVCLKVFRPELAGALGPERFRREVEFLTRLRHPRIVPILDSGEVGGLLYLVLAWVPGETLRTRLAREGPLSIPAVLSIARDVAAAIDYAHDENVLHRDIKPENILLEDDRAQVCDFGLARAIHRAAVEPLSSSGFVLGTPAYMSPEQGVGDPEMDAASDIYSLGCVLYEMLTGEPPFTGATPQAVFARHLNDSPRGMRSVRPDLPPRCEAAVLAALAKAPGDRPARAAELVRQLGG